MQSKSKHHMKVRNRCNEYLNDCPKSWRKTLLRIIRRRETRLIEKLWNEPK
jgi:hypothetical protein